MKPLKIIGLSALALIGAGILYSLLKSKTLSLAAKTGRWLTFSPSYCLGSVMSIPLPAVTDQFYDDSQVQPNADRIAQMEADYGSYVQTIATLTNLPAALIYAFMFIESAGNSMVVNGSAIGLMQISVTAATDIVFNEYHHGRLNSGEAEILSRNLGDRLQQIYAMKSPGTASVITAADLFNAELNILLGAIYLGQLIDESTSTDGLRLDKVIVRYNIGYFSFSRGRQLVGDIATVMGKVNPITRNYIAKMIGKNGILETCQALHCNG